MLWACCAEDKSADQMSTVAVLNLDSDDKGNREQSQPIEEDAVPAEGFSGKLAPMEFTILVEKPEVDSPLGMDIDFADGVMLHICGMQPAPTLISRTNEKAPEDQRVKLNDFIVAVNGVRENAGKMTEELQTQKRLELIMRRPYRFSIQMAKNGGAVGLDLHYAKEGKSLVVDSIMPGRVMDWNTANQDKQVCRHDRIVEVNGVSGMALELLDHISRSEMLDLLILRPAPEPAKAG